MATNNTRKKCIDCRKLLSVKKAERCQPCNNVFRKGNWPPPKKRLIVKKCFLCGNLNSLTFGQKRIWELKERVAHLRELKSVLENNLKSRWREHRRLQEKIDRATMFRYATLNQTNRRLTEMGKISDALKGQLKQTPRSNSYDTQR